VELYFESDKLDNGHMVVDFGLLKTTIKDIIMSFDNAITIWSKEGKNYKKDIHDMNVNYVIVPFSPSAEQYSNMILFLAENVLSCTKFRNGESNPKVISCRVAETRSGWAESSICFASYQDATNNMELEDFTFSSGVRSAWTYPDMWEMMMDYRDGTIQKKPFRNKKANQQIKEGKRNER